MIYRSKYLKDMQNGGGLSVFAPNPQPYRAPLQGLNPQVFQYNVNTAPLDTSNLIQVMQTKDVMDIKREQAAIEREKIKADADLAKQKLDYLKAKDQIQLSKEVFGVFGKMPGVNGDLGYADYTNSTRYKDRFIPIKNEIEETKKKLEEAVTVRPIDSQTPALIRNYTEKIRTLVANAPIEAAWKVDQAAMEALFTAQNDPKSKKRVTTIPFLMKLQKRVDNLSGIDNNYTNDMATDQSLWYEPAVEAKKFDKIMASQNTPRPITSFNIVSPDELNSYMETTKGNWVPNPDKAAENAAKAIFTDVKQTAFISETLGINLYDPDLTDEQKIKSIADALKPMIEYDDEAVTAENVKTRTLMRGKKPDSLSIIRYEGGVNSTRTTQGGVNSSVSYLGTGKTPTDAKSKAAYKQQANDLATTIIKDNNESNKNIQDAVRDMTVEMAGLVAPDVLAEAANNALTNYRATPAGDRTAGTLSNLVKVELLKNYNIDVNALQETNKATDAYIRLATGPKKILKWEDLKTIDDPLLKTNGKYKSDSSLKLIYSRINAMKAQINNENTDLNSGSTSIAKQIETNKTNTAPKKAWKLN